MTARSGRSTSFTAEILAELTAHTPPLACCRASLVDGMSLTGEATGGAAGDLVVSRVTAARAALRALHADRHPAHVERRPAARRSTYHVVIGEGLAGATAASSSRPCCARSRLRGAFLAAGTAARPDGPPHLEILARDEAAGTRLVGDFGRVGVQAVAVLRRGRWLAAVRSVDGVGAALSTIGAQSGRLRFEEGRVVRDLRGGVNRRLNAETANLRRTVSAGVRQLAAIAALRGDPERWEGLPPALREAAVLRDRHPQDSLDRLARRAACSRSAMADRLRRLVVTAEALTG